VIVNSKESAKECYCEILEQFVKHKFLNIKIAKDSRTLRQNAWQFKAYSMLSRQGDMTAAEYRNYCKFKFGLPIRAAEDAEFATLLRPMLTALTYEQKIQSMTFVDVTSTFDVAQMGEYIDAITMAFNDKELPEKDWRVNNGKQK